jgi:UDP-N-acetylmuramoyl-tripeptide--D-alanyl-D-alanine ligase
MNTTLSAAADMMHGKLHGADRDFDGVSIDTRSLASGELFVAISGPNFDGREFVAQAAGRGAAAAVVSKLTDTAISQIEVDDTRIALGQLGAAWRDQQDVRVVGITGSNGKTTLKELTAACLSQAATTIATHGNLNNDFGVPLMLSRIGSEHRYAVIEMGANHAGEIAYLTSLAKPDVVAITNAGAAHLEGFGSIKGVSRAKGEILQGEKRPAVAILNADDDYFDYWQSCANDIQVISFGIESKADVSAADIVLRGDEAHFELRLPSASMAIALPLAGIHNVRNACAAAAIALALGVSAEQIKRGLESVAPVSGRLQAVPGANGATLYDDSYNANPLSVVAAGEFIASLPGRTWLLLGDMAELGDDAKEMHRGVGAALRRAGVDRLAATGGLSTATVEAFGDGADWYPNVNALLDAVLPQIGADDVVLVKGSRSMRMERVVDGLRAPQTMCKEA